MKQKYCIKKGYSSLNLVNDIISNKKKERLLKKNNDYKNYIINGINYHKYDYIKRWVMALYNALPKGDSHLKYKIYIEKVIRNIMNKHNLLSFFSIIETHMSIFFMMFKKKIAGKNLLIPLSVNKSQRLNIISRLIISSLKLRMEQTFVDKLTAELLDIHNKKGLTITKRLNYVKQMKDNLSNIRFLNEKY